jgi:N-acetylglucosamine-6-phosphate deacetylase
LGDDPVVPTSFLARDPATASWVRLTLEGARIADLAPGAGPAEPTPDDDWVAPAFWDIQTNGRWGVSFSAPDLTVDQVTEVVRAQAALGTARLCPTLITASPDATAHGVGTIAAACDRFPDVAAMVLGLHLEGPYISPLDGYRGAHPIAAVRDPSWPEFAAWQGLSGGRIALMTLAPERPGAIDFIRRAVAAGVVVAIGHTAADGDALRAAADAGATLSTHLGNGIVSPLPRHPNAIWQQAADDRLTASLIADGHHLDRDTLKVLARAKTLDRVVLVSDHSPLAGLPVGTYGPWAVDPSGKIVVAGTPYLAGSNQDLDVGLSTLLGAIPELTLADAWKTVTAHPARLLNRPAPALAPGAPACLVRFRFDPDTRRVALRDTCVDGRWAEPEAPGQRAAKGTLAS